MRILLFLSAVLFLIPSIYADSSESRVRVAMAMAAANSSLQEVKKECCEESPWSWKINGDYAYLYWQGSYYATWQYSQNRYIHIVGQDNHRQVYYPRVIRNC